MPGYPDCANQMANDSYLGPFDVRIPRSVHPLQHSLKVVRAAKLPALMAGLRLFEHHDIDVLFVTINREATKSTLPVDLNFVPAEPPKRYSPD